MQLKKRSQIKLIQIQKQVKKIYIEGDSIVENVDGVGASKNESFKDTCHQGAKFFFQWKY